MGDTGKFVHRNRFPQTYSIHDEYEQVQAQKKANNDIVQQMILWFEAETCMDPKWILVEFKDRTEFAQYWPWA